MTTKNCWNDETEYDFSALVASLNQYLRLRATPVGMKRFRLDAGFETWPVCGNTGIAGGQ